MASRRKESSRISRTCTSRKAAAAWNSICKPRAASTSRFRRLREALVLHQHPALTPSNSSHRRRTSTSSLRNHRSRSLPLDDRGIRTTDFTIPTSADVTSTTIAGSTFMTTEDCTCTSLDQTVHRLSPMNT